MKGLVLDLRNNPGGLLDQAVGVASLFLDGGEVVSQRGRNPHDIQRYDAKGHDMLARAAAGGADQLAAPHRLPRSSPARCRIAIARRCRRHQLRQGLGADGDPVARRRRRRVEADHGALLHALRPLDPEDRHPAGRHHSRGHAARPQSSGDTKGEASLQGHLKNGPDEEHGSQAYVPADKSKDRNLHAAYDLLRGTKTLAMLKQEAAAAQAAEKSAEKTAETAGKDADKTEAKAEAAPGGKSDATAPKGQAPVVAPAPPAGPQGEPVLKPGPSDGKSK